MKCFPFVFYSPPKCSFFVSSISQFSFFRLRSNRFSQFIQVFAQWTNVIEKNHCILAAENKSITQFNISMTLSVRKPFRFVRFRGIIFSKHSFFDDLVKLSRVQNRKKPNPLLRSLFDLISIEIEINENPNEFWTKISIGVFRSQQFTLRWIN